MACIYLKNQAAFFSHGISSWQLFLKSKWCTHSKSQMTLQKQSKSIHRVWWNGITLLSVQMFFRSSNERALIWPYWLAFHDFFQIVFCFLFYQIDSIISIKFLWFDLKWLNHYHGLQSFVCFFVLYFICLRPSLTNLKNFRSQFSCIRIVSFKGCSKLIYSN